MGKAQLSSLGDLTSFSYEGTVLRFKTPRSLKRYVGVKEWDNGYLVVDALYEGHDEAVEEYIDLVPILRNLYRDPAQFCRSISEVCVAY